MRFIIAALLLSATQAGYAALIPYYFMDSSALLAEDIVLCQEEDVQIALIPHERWKELKVTVRQKVEQVFKGDLKPGAELTIAYDSLFRRRLAWDSDIWHDLAGEHPYPPLPAGRALLFLQKDKATGAWTVVTAKLIQRPTVYQYGQFSGNPGPLVLAEQGAENLKLPAGQAYGETELLQDLELALKKAATLKAPVPYSPFHLDTPLTTPPFNPLLPRARDPVTP